MKKYLFIIVGLLIIYLCGMVYYLGGQLKDAKSKNAELDSRLQSAIEVNNNQGKYTYRDSSGTAKQISFYVPPSGKVQVVAPKENTSYNLSWVDKVFNKVIETDNGYIIIKDKGFAFTPMLGIFYNSKLDASLNIELLFYNRYGLGIFGSYNKVVGIYISRNISDIFPIFKNTCVVVNYGFDVDKQSNKFGFGLGIYL